jgi:2-polyprenyl-3-methyl-5-hydroxy-6-metoxy-1,4-benzoquinol methylase
MKQESMDREIKASSLDKIHYKIIELTSDFKKGRILDLPAGPGRLSYWLYKKGFDVVAGDIDTRNFKNPEIPILKIDLNEKFPLKSDSFDIAFCIEGPEHVENPYHTFREFARVLKPGGKLIISYPNYSNLESRLRIIFYGILEPVEYPKRQGDGKIKVSKCNGHISRQPLALLKMSLMHAGFDIDMVTSESIKLNQLFLFPIYILIKLFTVIKGKKGQKKYDLQESNQYGVLMGGNSLIIKCTKNS